MIAYCLCLIGMRYSTLPSVTLPPQLQSNADWLEKQLRDQLDDEAGDASMWSDLLITQYSLHPG